MNHPLYETRLLLKQPAQSELDFRARILSDPNTMDFNKGLELDFDGYDNATGCIDFNKSKWNRWYDSWFNNKNFRYYAYLIEKESNIPIGEVAIRYDLSQKLNMMSIIIEGKHRTKGYGKEGLILLLNKGFKELELEEISDEFPEDRNISMTLFKEVGFKPLRKNGKDIILQIKKSYFLS